MNNFLRLTKINIKGIFINNNKKSNSQIILFLLGVFVLGFYSFYYAKIIMKGYLVLNIPYVILAQYMAITSIFILTTNFYRIKGLLFGFKDYDMLMSLPIRRRDIILSKIFSLYLTNIIYLLLLMIPSFVVYIINVNTPLIMYLLFFITLFIIPLVPIIISTIIGSILAIVSSKFKKSNIFNIVLSILLLIFIFYISNSVDITNSINLANIGKSMVNIFNKFYPLTNLYINIIKDYNLISLLEFILIPCILFIIYIVIVGKYFVIINNSITKEYTNSTFRLKKLNEMSSLKSLYKKEMKRYISSVNYVMNTAIGSILLILLSIVSLFLETDKLAMIMNDPNGTYLLTKATPLLIALFCALTCSTHSSISLEGKNFWIMKTIPVSPMKIFLSKIMINLTIIVPAVLLSSILLTISLKLSLVTFVLCIFTGVGYSLFISLIGLILNLIFPNFSWTSEIRVIKQSLPAFLSIFIGLIFAIIPFSLITEININKNIFILLITLFVYLLSLIMCFYLRKIGVKKFYRL